MSFVWFYLEGGQVVDRLAEVMGWFGFCRFKWGDLVGRLGMVNGV